MINDDLNRFLKTFFYPILNLELIYNNDFENFYKSTSKIEKVKKNKENLDNYIFKKRRKERDNIRKSAFEYLETKCNMYSYDMIHQYLEKWYLSDEKIKKYLGKDKYNLDLFDITFYNLKYLTKCLISKLDDKIIYKYWENENDKEFLGGFSGKNKIHLYRNLNQLIPTDILVVLFALDSKNKENELEKFFGNIAITDLTLESILKSGVAENHLHLGVTLTFSLTWDSLVKEIEKGESNSNNGFFLKYFSYTYKENDMYFYLCLARVIRKFLIYTIYFENIKDKYKENSKIDSKILEFNRQLQDYFCEFNYKKLKDKVFYSVEQKDILGEIERYFLEIQDLFNKNFYSIEEKIYSDSLKNVKTFEENKFLFIILQNILDGNKFKENNILIKRIFLDYLRLKNYFFNLCVQDKNIFGLQYFQTYYNQMSSRNKKYSNFKEDKILENCLNSLLYIKNLDKLELRTSFYNTESEAREYIKYFLEAYKKFIYNNCIDTIDGQEKIVKKLPKVGLVLHFRKTEEIDEIHCINLDKLDYMQYGKKYKEYKTQLEIFKKIRNPEKFPGIDKYLLGIDVCSAENTMPSWVFRDLFENARDSFEEPLYTNNTVSPFQSISFTCHAGEDFRHLMSGIRAIYEAVHYFKFHAGDRIGHGLALGTEPLEWYKKNNTVILPRIEALENYVWAYKILSIYSNNQDFTNSQYLRHRINELSKEIVPNYIPVENWVEAYDGLFLAGFEKLMNEYKRVCGDCEECYNNDFDDLKSICHILHKSNNKSTILDKQDILNMYHCAKQNTKMREPIHYKIPEQEIKIVIEVQKILKQMISDKGIVIEANPNSNVTIGDIDILDKHPLYNISSTNYDYGSILTCINSDNPGIFNTNVINEIGFIYFTMIEKGIGRELCTQWIERLRDCGMKYSFIRREESDEYILKELNNLIKCL